MTIQTDERTRQRVATFRQAGTGHNITRNCWTCHQPRSQEGGRLKGRLKLFECAQCKNAADAAEKAMA